MFSITNRVQSDTNLISSFTINIKHFTSKYFLDKNGEYSFVDTAADDCLSLLWYSHACILSTWSTGIYFSFCWKHFQDFIEFCFFHENFHPKNMYLEEKLTNYEWFSFKFFKIFHFFPLALDTNLGRNIHLWHGVGSRTILQSFDQFAFHKYRKCQLTWKQNVCFAGIKNVESLWNNCCYCT